MKTKNLSREQLLNSFLSRASDLSSSGLQIDSEGYLYASGEMIAAWQEDILFIDFGSDKVCNRKAANDLKELAEKEGVVYVPYNVHSYVISHEFQFAARMVSYTIWATPKDVNPINIFKQAQKVLDKAIEKAISYASIQELIDSTQHIATLFGFTFDASRYTAQATQGAQLERAKKQRLAQHHLNQYCRLKKELEAS
jgi:DNA polymerase III alpha subunit